MSRATRIAVGLALPVALVAIWVLVDRHSIFFTPPGTILSTFKHDWFGPDFSKDLVPSVVHLVLGFAWACVVGVALGVVMGRSRRLRRDLSPIVEFARGMPIIAVVPAAIVIIGPGLLMEVLLIGFSALFPILISTADGVRRVDPVQLDTAQIYGLSRARRLRLVILPGAMPQIMAGMRIATALGVAGMVVINMISSTGGVGYYVIYAQETFNVPAVWAGLFMIGLIGVSANLLVLLIEARVLAWHRGWTANARSAG
jgi:ABC-type nitrate/sulfonate/bicarbonate transport system permease component